MTNTHTTLPTSLPTVIVDTREQQPHHVFDGALCNFRRCGLEVGDYALEDCCVPIPGRVTLRPSFAVERKSVSDWLSSWHGKRRDGKFWTAADQRERLKILKAKSLGFPLVYVIDGDRRQMYSALQREPWKRLCLRWEAVAYHIAYLRVRGVQVITAPTKDAAEETIIKLLMAWKDKRVPANVSNDVSEGSAAE